MSSDVVRALEPVVATLEALGVAYRVGGSVASSALGVPRSTLDVDLVTELAIHHAEPFAKSLADDYYVDADMIRDAIRRRASFNVVHLETMTKVDIFIRRDGAFDREVFSRNARMTLEDGARTYDVTTAEDIILRKLEWFRLGNEISERQWADVIGVLRVQGSVLDREYMTRWAGDLGVSDLLKRAFAETDSARA